MQSLRSNISPRCWSTEIPRTRGFVVSVRVGRSALNPETKRDLRPETNISPVKIDRIPEEHLIFRGENATFRKGNWLLIDRCLKQQHRNRENTTQCTQQYPCCWSNYSDLTRPHPKWWFSKGSPVISGRSRLVKYDILARRLWLRKFLSLSWLRICSLHQKSPGFAETKSGHSKFPVVVG